MSRWWFVERRKERRSRRFRWGDGSTVAPHVDVLESRVMLSASSLTTHLSEVGDHLEGLLDTVQEKVTSVVGSKLDFLHDLFHDDESEESETQTESLSETESHLEEVFNNISDKIEQTLDSVFQRVEEKLEKVAQTIEDRLGGDEEEEEEALSVSTLSSNLPALPEELDELVNQHVDELTQTLVGDSEQTETLKSLLDDLPIKNLLGDDPEPLQTLFDAADELDLDGFEELAAELRQFAERINEVKTEIENRAAELAQQFPDVEAEDIEAHLRERVEDRLEELFGSGADDGPLGFASHLVDSLFAGLDLEDLL